MLTWRGSASEHPGSPEQWLCSFSTLFFLPHPLAVAYLALLVSLLTSTWNAQPCKARHQRCPAGHAHVSAPGARARVGQALHQVADRVHPEISQLQVRLCIWQAGCQQTLHSSPLCACSVVYDDEASLKPGRPHVIGVPFSCSPAAWSQAASAHSRPFRIRDACLPAHPWKERLPFHNLAYWQDASCHPLPADPSAALLSM